MVGKPFITITKNQQIYAILFLLLLVFITILTVLCLVSYYTSLPPDPNFKWETKDVPVGSTFFSLGSTYLIVAIVFSFLLSLIVVAAGRFIQWVIKKITGRYLIELED